jgi:hypothetical protein
VVAPTRFKNGVSTQAVGLNLGMYPLPDPTDGYTDFHDFGQYAAADWTVTNTTSHGTAALIAGAGGLVALAGGATSVTNDIVAIQSNPLDFQFTTSQQVWFYASFKATTALNDQLQLGITTSNAALAPTDGIYFNKNAASTAIDFVVRAGSVSTTLASVATLANNAFIEVGFYYNGKDAVDVFVNEVKVGSVTTLTNFPHDVALGVGFGVKAAATAPTTSNIVVDFTFAAQDRAY